MGAVVIGNIVKWVLAVGACLAAWPSAAAPVQIGQIATGYVYYNRPGASLVDHNADLAACIRDTGAANVPRADPQSVGITAPVGGLIFQMIWNGPIAGTVADEVENCMIVRRWRAVRLPDEEGQGLAALSTPDLAARLTPWIGAGAPHGVIVRWFNNEADRPVDYEIASRPARPGASQLSLRLFAAEPPASPDPAAAVPSPAATAPPALDPRWPTHPLKPAEIASVPPFAGVILVRIKGIGPKGGGGMVFARQGRRRDAPPSIDDHAPDYVVGAMGWIYAKREGNWFAFAVPPGRWRIASSGFLSYCLGSPSFEVGAGEVVYAGTVDLAGQSFGPDLDLEPAKTYLAAASPAAKLRPAAYRNGSRGSCRGFGVIYALEIPGAPFDPDYAWGGAPGR